MAHNIIFDPVTGEPRCSQCGAIPPSTGFPGPCPAIQQPVEAPAPVPAPAPGLTSPSPLLSSHRSPGFRTGRPPLPIGIKAIHAAGREWNVAAHNESASLPTEIANTTIKCGTINLLVRQAWIELKNNILSGRALGKHVLLTGKAGRGKSAFVSYLLAAILLNARWCRTRSREELLAQLEEQEPRELVSAKRRRIRLESDEERIDRLTNPVITLVTRSGCGVGRVTIRLSLDSVVVCQCTPRDAHYYINDYVSGGEVKCLGSFLTMGVTTGETQKGRFEKNLAEEGGDSFIMLSPSMEELRLMFNDLSEEELNRRIDVVGHNPCLLNEMDGTEVFNGHIVLDREVYGIVTQAAREALGEDHPFFSWAIEKLVEELRTTKTDGGAGSDMPLLSMFLEYVPSNIPPSSNADWIDEVSASPFMAFVHGKLIEHVESSTDATLKAAVDRSGLWKCHAYDCHQFLLQMTANQTHLCWSATRNTWVPLVLGPITDKADDKRRIVHVRSINDITSLTPRDYGLPSMCTFPLIDSILTPHIATQITTSSRHRGAVAQLGQSMESMTVGDQTMTLIFFVLTYHISDFVFPTDLPGVDLYATVPVNSITMEEATRMRS